MKLDYSQDKEDTKEEISTNDLHKWRPISIWEKMREVTKSTKNHQLSSKFSKLKQALFPKGRGKYYMKESLKSQKRQKQNIQSHSNQLFMQWKKELENFTDIHPVDYNAPPLSVTKVKEFAFRSSSRDRNSPSKFIPPSVGLNNHRLFTMSQGSNANYNKLSHFFDIDMNKIYNRSNIQSNRNKRSTLSKISNVRPKTKRDHITRFSTYNLYLSPQRPNDKFKLNFDMAIMDKISNRPVLKQMPKEASQNWKNIDVKFKNIFVF